MALPDGMNEISVSGLQSSGAHFEGDLSAVIGGVHQDMREDIFDAAGPRLSLAVAVLDGLIESGRKQAGKEFGPRGKHFIGEGETLVDG